MSYPYHYQQPQLPPVQTQPVTVVPVSGMAVTSLTLGLLGLVFGCCTFGIFSIAGFIFGCVAYRDTKSGRRGGHGMTVAGLWLGGLLAIPNAILTVMIMTGSVSGA